MSLARKYFQSSIFKTKFEIEIKRNLSQKINLLQFIASMGNLTILSNNVD